jgi:hypothetical protein
MDVFKTIKDAAKKAGDAVKSGNAETTGIGSELAERAKMNRLAQGDPTSTPVESKPKSEGEPVHAQGPYGSGSGEKRLDTSYLDKPTAVKPPVYDKGGKVNVNDGKHQVAILKHGERVLTEKQDEEYQDLKKGKHKEPDADDAENYDEGGKVHTPEEKVHFARSMNSLNAGGLHRHLGISEDKPIPLSKKKEAAGSSNKHVAAMGRIALAMHNWKH